jgi:hypothetical protein
MLAQVDETALELLQLLDEDLLDLLELALLRGQPRLELLVLLQ